MRVLDAEFEDVYQTFPVESPEVNQPETPTIPEPIQAQTVVSIATQPVNSPVETMPTVTTPEKESIRVVITQPAAITTATDDVQPAMAGSENTMQSFANIPGYVSPEYAGAGGVGGDYISDGGGGFVYVGATFGGGGGGSDEVDYAEPTTTKVIIYTAPEETPVETTPNITTPEKEALAATNSTATTTTATTNTTATKTEDLLFGYPRQDVYLIGGVLGFIGLLMLSK